MTPRKSYSRYFIILQEEQKGYGLDADKAPSGYAKLEVKNNRSKISYYVQNLKKDKGPYYMILITDKQNPRSLINLGRLNIDDNGRADVNFDYDMNSIGGTNIAMDKVVGAAVVYMNGKVIPVMIGFSTTDVPKDWTTYPIAKGTPQQQTTGTGSAGTGTTGTGTTTKPPTSTGTTGAGGMGTGTGGTGTGTVTKPPTSTGTTTGAGGMGTGTVGTGTTGTGTTGTGTTTKPPTSTGTTTGAGTMGTGTVGTGTIGTGTTGTGTTTKPPTSTGTTTGAGTMGAGTVGTGTTGTGTTGTGTTTKPPTSTGTTGAGGMGAGTVGTGTMGTGAVGTGTGTTGAGAGMGTQPTAGNGFVDEFEDYYEDVNIINMTPASGGNVPSPREIDIFERYEEEIENSKSERHKHKKCKHHKDEDDCGNSYFECMEDDDYDDCKHHKNKHDDCGHHMMQDMQDEDHGNNHCEHCNNHKKEYKNFNDCDKDGGSKYNWPLGNTGEFFKNIVKGFEKLGENENIKNCLWYKVPVNKLEDMYCIYDYNKYTVIFYPMICYYPYISKKKDFIVGYKCDDEGNLKYIIYGIAGTKAIEDQPYGGKTGFVTWMPCKEERDMGYWIMYYDFKTNNVVIPIKRS